MRILVVTTTVGTVNGFLLPHIRQLQIDGHEVEIACQGSTDVRSDRLIMRPRIHEVPFSRNPIARQNGKAYVAMRRVIADGGFDIVHTHTPVASTLVRLAARRSPNVRVFYTAHGFHFYSGAPVLNWLIYYPIESILSRATDTLITINSEDYERARRHFHPGQLVLSPGVGIEPLQDPQQIAGVQQSARRSEDEFLVLSVGELNRNKGHETVIRAISRLGDKQITYLIAGSGSRRKRLEKLARQLGLVDQVRLLGQRSDVAQLLESVDVYVHPSYREGLPVAVLEAMRAGTPIVASDIRGCRDALGRADAGLLVNPGDPEAFARALQELRGAPRLRARLGAAARAEVKRFEIDQVLRLLRKLYTELPPSQPGSDRTHAN